MKTNVARIITEHEIFHLFPDFEKPLVREMIAVGETKNFNHGEIIMRSGQNIRSALIVLKGLVKIYRQDDEGNEYFMYYINPGKACAISLVCASGVETSGLIAKAVTDADILSIPLNYVEDWMMKYKTWAQFALESYRDRFDELLLTIDHIAFRNMDERLIFYLKREREELKNNIISTPFAVIARELNTSREVISRLMKKLAEKGSIRLHRSHIEIVSFNKILM
jgi:CRP/FNR family transcriptional regulator, anaerobic regulatory protein